MNPISINGTALLKQPPILLEEPIPIQTDNEAVDGTTQRNYISFKWQSKMGFTYLTPAQVQAFNTLFLGNSAVTYQNTMSAMISGGTLSFSGLGTFTFGEYLRGANMFVPYTITIRQV